MQLRIIILGILIFLGPAVRAVECRPHFTFGYYLVHKLVFRAKVKRIDPFNVHLQVLECWNRPGEPPRHLVFKNSYVYRKFTSCDCVMKDILTKKKEYIIFVGEDMHHPGKFVYTEPCRRFVVQSDSVFIGSPFLRNLDGIDSATYCSENTFGDELMPYGHKISVEDFKILVEEVNKSISMRIVSNNVGIYSYSGWRVKRLQPKTRPDYTYYEPETQDPLTLAIIAQLKKAWGL